MNWDAFLLFDALALAVAAAVVDVQRHRIPNWLTYPGIALGTLLRSLFFGWKGLESAVAGCLLGGGLVFLFYAVRAMGAGDVKLLAAIGSFAGSVRCDCGACCHSDFRWRVSYRLCGLAAPRRRNA